MKTMKTIISVTSVLAALTLAMLPAKAQVTYTGSGFSNGGAAATDGAGISSVVVNNTASDITFTINSSAIQSAYIFFAIDIQNGAGGYTVLSNPIWAGSPTLGISTGETAVLNDNAGTFGAYTYGGGIWTQNAGGAVTGGGPTFNYVTMTVPLSSLGLSVGNSFNFDVVSTFTSWQNGSPQSAYGALDTATTPAETDGSYTPWNPTVATFYDSATATGSTFSSTIYTVAVPEPATLALLSGGVILLLVQRRRVSGNRAA